MTFSGLGLTYTFSELSTWTSKVSLAKGSGGRSFFFSLQPAEACRPGVNLAALGWVEPKPGEKLSQKIAKYAQWEAVLGAKDAAWTRVGLLHSHGRDQTGGFVIAVCSRA